MGYLTSSCGKNVNNPQIRAMEFGLVETCAFHSPFLKKIYSRVSHVDYPFASALKQKNTTKTNPILLWNRQAGGPALHPVQGWCSLSLGSRQGETFPLSIREPHNLNLIHLTST